MSHDSVRVERAALETDRDNNPLRALLRSSAGRNAGLVIALLLLGIVGAISAGDRFTSTDNALTILRLASTMCSMTSVGRSASR